MLFLIAVTARLAGADTFAAGGELAAMAERIPGSPDDPVAPFLDQALAVRTRAGFSIEGGEAPLLLDGFVIVPRQADGTHIVRTSAIQMLELHDDGDAMYAENGTLELTSGARFGTAAEVSTREVALSYRVITVRLDTLGLALPHFVPADRELSFGSAPTSVAVQYHATIHRGHWLVAANVLGSIGGVTYYTDRTEHPDQRVRRTDFEDRVTFAERYAAGPWRLDLSQSVDDRRRQAERGLLQHDERQSYAVETRAQVQRDLGNVAGLTQLVWLLGGEAHVRRYDLDVVGAPEDRENIARVSATPFDDTSHAFEGIVWTPDIAASTGVVAHLSTRLSTYLALRLDGFGTDLALEPRGHLRVDLGDGRYAMLVAGAYRRAPEQGEELEHDGLHPERTTRVALQVGQGRQGRGSDEPGFAGYAQVYYDDRTRLIERDGFGTLGNTGNGTTYGAFAIASEHWDHWLGQVSIRLEHSERQTASRARIRPYEYDQPVRLDARLQRRAGAWMFGAHFSLREGLPDTPVNSAIYDSDRDVYLPQFGILYTERLPWRHQLDVRVDRELTSGRVKLSAYLDIANVYDQRSAIGWAYNFNFAQRRAIESAPIVPTLGLRGEL